MPTKSHITSMPGYYDQYINKIGDISVVQALEEFGPGLLIQEKEKLTRLGNRVYAEGKWTARDIVQHLIDSERVFAYRALRLSRNDGTPLPGFEENLFAETANAVTRNLADLLEEFKTSRLSTIQLFRSFSDEMLMREGICSEKKISVLAIGFSMAGHVLHHVDVLKERYFPLLTD